MNIIITGASKGIGKAIAARFAKEGATIGICARNEADLLQTKVQLEQLHENCKVIAEVRDLSLKEDVKAFAKSMLEKMGQIDLLVNNAGAFLPGNVMDEEEGRLEKLIETNLYSAYHLTRAVLPSMKLNDLHAGSRGHIFNICSVAGLQAYPNGGSYSISKYALVGFSKNLREELKPYHIKVTTVNPGATMSDSWSGSGIDEERIMKASDVAETIYGVYHLSPQAVVEEITLRPMLGDL